jgi:hypothetical protein
MPEAQGFDFMLNFDFSTIAGTGKRKSEQR